MSRPALEVADIFRDHGAAWRRANAGHVSLDQMKVMRRSSAAARRRSAGMSRAARSCAHTVIAYNSCRNRHCPKCQGAAAKEWLAEREAELLPVPYFHVVFTLPAAIADIAYQNKAAIYDILFKASAETMTHHRGRSQAPRRPHRHHLRAPHLGLGADAPSARAHDRAGRRHLRSTARAGSSCRPDFFLPVHVLSRLFRGLFLAKLVAAHRAGRLKFFGDHARLDDTRAFKAYLAPLRKIEWVVYAKRPFGGPQAVLAYLSRYTHRVAISNRRLIAADDERRHLPLEGLPDRRARPLEDHDARHRTSSSAAS